MRFPITPRYTSPSAQAHAPILVRPPTSGRVDRCPAPKGRPSHRPEARAHARAASEARCTAPKNRSKPQSKRGAHPARTEAGSHPQEQSGASDGARAAAPAEPARSRTRDTAPWPKRSKRWRGMHGPDLAQGGEPGHSPKNEAQRAAGGAAHRPGPAPVRCERRSPKSEAEQATAGEPPHRPDPARSGARRSPTAETKQAVAGDAHGPGPAQGGGEGAALRRSAASNDGSCAQPNPVRIGGRGRSQSEAEQATSGRTPGALHRPNHAQLRERSAASGPAPVGGKAQPHKRSERRGRCTWTGPRARRGQGASPTSEAQRATGVWGGAPASGSGVAPGQHDEGVAGKEPPGSDHTTPKLRVGEEGFEPSHPFGHTDLNRARLPFRHPPVGAVPFPGA